MEHILKKLRKLENTSLLIVSKDDDFVTRANEIFTSCKSIKSTASNSEVLKLFEENHFDVVVIDTNSENFKELLYKMEDANITSTKVVVLDKDNEEDIIVAVNSDIYNIIAKPLSFVNLKLSVIMSLNQTKRSDKINLGRGYYFDTYRDRAYSRTGKAIELTKLEIGLLKLIIDNYGKVVTYDMIKKTVWKGKKMSIFTMRNVVNKIRIKTHQDIFQNVSSQGYIIK